MTMVRLPQFAAAQAASFAVGVQDRRPYVISGNKQPDFVGLSRGGYGNPFDVTTESGRALADEFSTAIANGFRQNDVGVTAVRLSPTLAPFQARQALVDTGAEKALLLTLNEWKADTFSATALIYNVELLIMTTMARLSPAHLDKEKTTLGEVLGTLPLTPAR